MVCKVRYKIYASGVHQNFSDRKFRKFCGWARSSKTAISFSLIGKNAPTFWNKQLLYHRGIEARTGKVALRAKIIAVLSKGIRKTCTLYSNGTEMLHPVRTKLQMNNAIKLLLLFHGELSVRTSALTIRVNFSYVTYPITSKTYAQFISSNNWLVRI